MNDIIFFKRLDILLVEKSPSDADNLKKSNCSPAISTSIVITHFPI